MDQNVGSTLGEIVVTAEKRSESLNRVGLTVSAITADDLKAQEISSVEDIARVTPGLSFASSYTNTPVYTLRGVGFNDSSLGAYPDVSVYVDEVPLPFPALTTQAGLDLERVEILKGPQGILFGTNATGGAINYIAAKPTRDFQAGGDISFGRFATLETEDYISGPLADDLLARLSVKVENGGDWQRSDTRDDTLGKREIFAGRVLLDWTPSAWAKFELNINGWLNQSDPQAPQYVRFDPGQPGHGQVGLVDSPFAAGNDRSADWSPDPRPHGTDSFYQTSLRGDIQATDDITITSISSYVGYTRNDQINADGVATNVANYNAIGSIHSFSQEVRAANASQDRLRWVIGGNVEHSTVVDNDNFLYPDASAEAVLGISNNFFSSTQDLLNYAAFGDVAFDVSQQLSVKGGARYTRNDRTAYQCNAPGSAAGGTAAVFQALSEEITGTKVAPIAPNQCFVLLADYLPSITPYKTELDQSNVSWQGGIDYKPSDTALLYFNVTKGYKAGSIPSLSASTVNEYAAVSQESVLDYEAGLKIQLIDKTLYVTGAAFYYDYTNKQVLGNLKDPVFGLEPLLINVPKSFVKGGETSLIWAPITGVSTSLSMTYLDTRVVQYDGYNPEGVVANLAGGPLPFNSRWSGVFDTEYRHSLYGEYDGFIGGDVTGRTRETTVIGADAEEYTNEYFLVDLRLGVVTHDGTTRASLWGKNILDRYYWNNVYRQPDDTVRYAGFPATFGVTISHKFK
jgi:iron complex outermembrane recepter protein